MLKCYIIDDELHAINILKHFVEEIPGLVLAGFNNNPIIALQEVNALNPDIVFLDIDMPGLNGIDFLNLITSETKVVFTTASPDFALKAFEMDAFDYLLKPISLARFQNSINKYNSLYAKKESLNTEKPAVDYLYIKSDNKGKMYRLATEDILYIESNNNYITINIINGQHKVYLTLKEFESNLPGNAFIRIHKSFIVNQTKIDHIHGNQVVLKDKTVLQLGNTYKELFLRLIAPFIIKSDR